MFVLFMVLASIVLSMIDLALGFGTTSHVVGSEPFGFWATWSYAGGGPLLLIFSLAMIIPGLAVGVRRLHDTDRSGWWLLIGFVPLVGGIVLLVFMIMSGTRGPNRFGADPIETTA